MKLLVLRFRAVILVLAVLFCAVFSSSVLVSCGKNTGALPLMNEFCESYGLSGTVFSPSVSEGEAGYVTESFFISVYGETPNSVSDYAIVFTSTLDRAGECAVFLCYSEYDALLVCDMLRRRVDLIKSMGSGIDTENADDAVVFKSGRYAVMCALSDNETALRIWRKLL